jgi:hypothetical protein
VLGSVPGRVQDADRDRSQLDFLAVLERLECVLRFGGWMDQDRQPMIECKPSVAGDVVGVRVGLQNPNELHAVCLRLLEVALDLVGGIDDDRNPRILVADQV